MKKTALFVAFIGFVHLLQGAYETWSQPDVPVQNLLYISAFIHLNIAVSLYLLGEIKQLKNTLKSPENSLKNHVKKIP